MTLDKEQIAQTLTSVRHGKGLKQKDITDQLMSRTTYSKIERGVIAPGIDNFHNIMGRLNISFDEFFYIYNGYRFDDRWEIINAFKQTRGNFDVAQLNKIIQQCQSFLSKQDDLHIENIQQVCQALLALNENNMEEAKVIAADVWEHLSERNTWYFDDVLLVNNILFLFEEETMAEMYKRSVLTLDKYQGFEYQLKKTILFSLKLNTFSYKMFYDSEHTVTVAEIDDLIKDATQMRYYDMKAVLLVRKGLVMNDDTFIQQGLSILELLELEGLKTSVESEIAMYNTVTD